MNGIRKSLIFLITIILLIGVIQPLFTYISASYYEGYPFNLSQQTSPSIVGFSRNILLSTDDSIYPQHVEVSMAISDNGVIFVGWKEALGHNTGGIDVSIVRSTDDGNTWTSPYSMNNYNGLNTGKSDPWLYWFNGTLYYAYLEYEFTGSLTQITVAKSIDYGISWTEVNATNADYFADKETIVVGENNTVYVVYDDVDTSSIDGNATIRVSRSLNGGDTYQEISIIGEDEFFVGPFVTLNSSGDPFVAWSWVPDEGGNLYLSKSHDGGITFEQPQIVNDDGNYSAFEPAGGYPGKATLPVIKFDQYDRLYILWADKFEQVTNSYDVYLRYSDNFGSNWSDRIRVNPSIAGDQWNPDMVIDTTGKLHIAYYSEIDGYYRSYYRTVNFTGIGRNETTLSNEIQIANRRTSSSFTRPGEYLAIQLDRNDIPHVAWSDGRNDEMDIYYAYGLTELPYPPIYTLIIIIIIISIIGTLTLVTLFYLRKKRSSSMKDEEKSIEREKISVDRTSEERRKLYMKTYPYFCENCKKFNTIRDYCENCGSKDSIRYASKVDYKNYL